MIVTVFGATGFVGRYLVSRLAKTGATVRIATRSPASAYFLRPLGDIGQVVPVRCNIHDENSVRAALEGASHAVNLIGILAEKGQNSFDNIHHLAALRIADAAAKTGVKKLVHVSAIGADIKSKSAYARSKGFGEQSVHLAFADATILRPSIIFGPEDNFFNRFARMARLSPFLPLIGGGKTKFQPVYVGDVTDAIMVALEKKDTDGKIYELGGPDILSFRELLEKMMAITEHRRFLVSIPWLLAAILGIMLGKLPGTVLTLDQVRGLKTDNIVHKNAKGFKEIGITPKSLDTLLPLYLARFRRGGQKHRANPAKIV